MLASLNYSVGDKVIAKKYALASLALEKKYKIRFGLSMFNYFILAKEENSIFHFKKDTHTLFAPIFLLRDKIDTDNYKFFNLIYIRNSIPSIVLNLKLCDIVKYILRTVEN
ncbi:MAG: hypothetical protein KGJ07_00910 [Patescibacteria group bacterium]|nr:hypothetical protein [Patescibacteria group bacterium]MDE2588573.1 hypothetical protein [Patescibacteria group bacterium]